MFLLELKTTQQKHMEEMNMRKKDIKILQQLENAVARNAYNKHFTLTKSRRKFYSPYFIIEHCFTNVNELKIRDFEPDLTYFYKKISTTDFHQVDYFPGPEKVKKNIQAIAGKKYSVNVSLGTNDFMVNARYFYLLCELLEADSVYATNTAIDPICISGKNGKAFLLPINRCPGACLGYRKIA